MSIAAFVVSVVALAVSGAALFRTVFREHETLHLQLTSGGMSSSPDLVLVEVRRHGRPTVLNDLTFFGEEGQRLVGWHMAQPDDMLLADASKAPPAIIAQTVQALRDLKGLGVIPPPLVKHTLADGQMALFALIVQLGGAPEHVYCTVASSRSPKLATSNKTFVGFTLPASVNPVTQEGDTA